RWLGHMSQKGMEVLFHFGYLHGFSFIDFSTCEHCLFGKQTQSPHKRGSTHKSELLSLVHSDVCGPMPIVSMGGGHSILSPSLMIFHVKCGLILLEAKIRF
ncbi:hypothetical protein HA385_23025, partial [Escherichia coli]|nr:hypothetical protein [Escherichia coli]